MTTPLHTPPFRALPQGIDSLVRDAARCTTLVALRCVLEGLAEPLLALGHCAQFDKAERTRRTVHDDSVVSIVLMGWLPGQASAIHDHGGSLCVFRVLRGVATESRYDLSAGGMAVEAARDHFLPGSVVACDGSEIHSLMNGEAASEPLVTLHVYRPAPRMRTFSMSGGVVP